jgi:ATP-dependent exoDNAse (exonuclease V) beta subunit
VDRPERILAITFTRKATRETRERIVQRLIQAASGVAPAQAHERLAVELAKAALRHDQELSWNLLQNPGRLRIFTIDGLCSQLLARDPERGSYLAGRTVPDDPEPLYREAVQRMFEDLGVWGYGHGRLNAPRWCGAAHLDGDAKILQDLLVSMLAIRDQWTRG